MDNYLAPAREIRRMMAEIQRIEDEIRRLHDLREAEGLGENLPALRGLAMSTCMRKRPNIGTFYAHLDPEYLICSYCVKFFNGEDLTPITRYHCLIPSRRIGNPSCLQCGTTLLTGRLPSHCRDCRNAWRINQPMAQRTIINTDTRRTL